MIGIKETYVGSLRLYLKGDVHIQDDTRSIKIVVPKSKFKRDLSEAMSSMEKIMDSKVIELDNNYDLVLIKTGGDIGLHVHRKGTPKNSLESFIQSI